MRRWNLFIYFYLRNKIKKVLFSRGKNIILKEINKNFNNYIKKSKIYTVIDKTIETANLIKVCVTLIIIVNYQ